MERTTRQKINKKIEDLDNTIKQLDIANISRHSTINRIHILSSALGTFSRIDYMPDEKGILHHLKGLKSYKITSLTTME